MIKHTLYFSNPCFLRKKDMQLNISFPEEEKKDDSAVPIEDIGLIVLDNPHITLTNALLMALNENNAAIISCDKSHLPLGLMLPMFSHNTFTEKLQFQLEASQPLTKNLWQQTVIAKIENQKALLEREGIDIKKMDFLITEVKSGDPGNVEGRAASYYWDNLFGSGEFLRSRFGEPPNNLLNYGYAVLRAIVARSLVASGLFPSIGIHHRNKYNPYCLADDIMEPFRPFVDSLVLDIARANPEMEDLTPDLKRQLLQIPVIDVVIDDKSSPLMVGIQRTTSSLASCFEGDLRKILYPVFQ
ncbi:MAG TPA: type II CRISPR-associated endonuclease Cas1 [Bacteroidales bacterium]|nr:type II CRISPR-associated endonuclease Cas1 [Bacteroidales bacterium]